MSVESVVINIAFFTAFVVLYKPLQKTLKVALFSYLNGIRTNIDSKLDSKEKYDELLKKICQKNDNLNNEVEEILNNAKLTARHIEDNAKRDIEEVIKKRLDYTRKKISDENLILMSNIKKNCVNVATETLKKIISDEFNNSADQKTILKSSCDEMGSKLN